ncbi:hypothetical protein KI387_041655, partial [Taxus chinensis]
ADLIDEAIMEVNKTGPNCEQEAQEISCFSPTSSLQKYDFLDEFKLASCMLENEVAHGEENVDFEVTIQEVKSFLQWDREEFDCLSDLEECLKEEPTEITTFSSPSSSIFQTQEPIVMEENFHLQQPTSYNSSLESRMEDLNLPCSSFKEEKGKKISTIASKPSIQEVLQEDSIFGMENQSYGHIKRIKTYSI